MAEKKLRLGVVGLGVGAGHAVAYKNMPDAELVAICDTSEPWLEHCRKEWEVPMTFTDYREMFALPELDAVSIAVPTSYHAPLTIAALQAGKHVLVEKPMSVTNAEAVEMARAAQTSGRTLMISHNQRYCPEVMYLKRYIEEGHLGDVYFVRTIWRRPMGVLPPPTYNRATGSYDRNWFNDASKGGGVIRDLGSHVIDIALWLMGFPEYEDAMGSTYNLFLPDYLKEAGVASDADDHSAGFVKFKNGASMQVEVSFGQHIDTEQIVTEIFGTKGGALRVIGQPPRLFGYTAGAYATTIPNLQEQPCSTQSEFVQSILQGRPPMITAEQGVAVMKVINGICGTP